MTNKPPAAAQIVIDVVIKNEQMVTNVRGPLHQKAFVIKALAAAINVVVDFSPPVIIPANTVPVNGNGHKN